MLTEEDAKTKWCHVCLVAKNAIPLSNGWDGKCLASACMAWRWYEPDLGIKNKPGTGYCGLAGKVT